MVVLDRYCNRRSYWLLDLGIDMNVSISAIEDAHKYVVSRAKIMFQCDPVGLVHVLGSLEKTRLNMFKTTDYYKWAKRKTNDK